MQEKITCMKGVLLREASLRPDGEQNPAPLFFGEASVLSFFFLTDVPPGTLWLQRGSGHEEGAEKKGKH